MTRTARAGSAFALVAAGAALCQAQDVPPDETPSSIGMVATVVGAKEIAGASPSQHVCKVRVLFSGGGVGHGPNFYGSWTFSTTGAVESQANVTNGTILEFTFPVSTTTSAPFDGLLTGSGSEPATVNGKPGHIVYNENVAYTPFRLRQFPVDAVAVDSRKTYAPPDKDGAYPAVDPNADLRNVAFSGWNYHGGLFVGNAAGVGGDQSGVARIQCLATDPGNVPTCVYTLSLLQIGSPSYFNAAKTGWDGSMAIQAMVPSGTYVPTPNSQVTWATALDPSAATAAGSLDLANAPTNEYVNVPFSSAFPACVLLKAADETSPAWRYFGGSAFSPPSPSYPYSECKPHLWGCDVPTARQTLRTSYATEDGGSTGGGGGTTPPSTGGGGTTPTNPSPTNPSPTNPTPAPSGAASPDAARAAQSKPSSTKPASTKRRSPSSKGAKTPAPKAKKRPRKGSR